jgi:hypothetical protein
LFSYSSWVFKLAKRILVGKPVPVDKLCLNHFVLATEHSAGDGVTTVQQFKKFMSKLQGNNQEDPRATEAARILRRLEEREDANDAFKSAQLEQQDELLKQVNELKLQIGELMGELNSAKNKGSTSSPIRVSKKSAAASPTRVGRFSLTRVTSTPSPSQLKSPNK